MTFLEHLEDLRKRLFNIFIGVFVGVIPCWIFAKDLYQIIARPVTQYLPAGTKLAFTHLTAPFMLYMKIAFLAALIFTSPFVFLQIWYFIAPGLYQKERKYVFPFVFFTTVFFIGGILFAYYLVFPWACRFFLQLGSDFQPVITVDQYFTLRPPGPPRASASSSSSRPSSISWPRSASSRPAGWSATSSTPSSSSSSSPPSSRRRRT